MLNWPGAGYHEIPFRKTNQVTDSASWERTLLSVRLGSTVRDVVMNDFGEEPLLLGFSAPLALFLQDRESI